MKSVQPMLKVAILLVLAAPSVISPAEVFRELDLIRPSRTKAAPEFTVPGVKGDRIDLRDLKGKAVLLNFWATWCAPCREEMPSMERLHHQYKDRGLRVVAISVDSAGADTVARFVKSLGLTFSIGLDPKQEVANRYGVRALPSTFLLDRNGNTAAMALGPRDWSGPAAYAVIETLLK